MIVMVIMVIIVIVVIIIIIIIIRWELKEQFIKNYYSLVYINDLYL